jgi:hypothetical protein
LLAIGEVCALKEAVFRLLFICLLSSLFLVRATGQGVPAAPPGGQTQKDAAAPAAVIEPAPDFSKAFALLRALGMPSVKEALPRRGERDFAFGGDNGAFEMLSSYLWEKPGRDGGKMVVVGQTVEVPAVNKAADEEEMDPRTMQMQMMMAMAGGSGASQHASEVLSILATPIEVNRLRNGTPDLDLAKKLQGQLGLFDNDAFSEWSLGRTVGVLARALLFAAQLDERGHHEVANGLARSVLTTPAGAEIVLSHAVTMVAEAAYAGAFHRYCLSGDKEAWKTDLEGILSKFSRGYANAIAVRLALADVTNTLEPKPLANPDAEALAKVWRTKELDELALQRLANALNILSGGRNSMMSYDADGEEARKPPMPWLLDPDLSKATDPLGQLLAKGFEALPILMALAADTSATPTSVMNLRVQTGYSYYSSGGSGADEKALEHYRKTMPRPATVGEIATVLLNSALTGLDEREPSPPPERAVELTAAWLESLPARTPAALADHYFESGNPVQKSAMLRIFLSDSEPARVQKAEEYLLSARPRSESLDLVREYLTSRGVAAADFLARYRKAVEEEMEGADKEFFYREWSAYESSAARARKKVEGMLKTFDALVKGVDVDTLFRQVAENEDEEETGQSLRMLQAELKKLKPSEAVARWLAAVVRTEDALQRGRLLGYARHILRPSPMTDPEKEHWKTLLEDNRDAYPEEDRGGGIYGKNGPSVAWLAAGAWTNLNSPEMNDDNERMYRLYHVLGGEGLQQTLLVRAKAAVAGETIPPWPDEEKLTEPEREAMVAKLNALPGGEVAPAIEALGYKEKFSLYALEEPIEAFRKASWFVGEVELEEGSEKAFAFTREWKGQMLKAAMIEQLIAEMRKEEGAGFEWYIGMGGSLPGIRVQSGEAENRINPGLELKKPALLAMLVIMPSGGNGSDGPMRLQAMFLDETDEAALEEEEQKKLAEAVAKFNETLAKALEHDPKQQLQIQISLYRLSPGKPEDDDSSLPGL